MTDSILEARAVAQSDSTLAESALPDSAVSWSAIIAGALVASAFTLALLTLGAGIGLVSISPWSSGIGATTFGVLAAAWFIATQLFASGAGGYLAGRLRMRWAADPDEVYFRDTAHGLLVWGLGAVVTAGLLAVAGSSLVGGAAHIGASAVQASTASPGPAPGSAAGNSAGYFIDMLFRSDRPAAGDAAAAQAEVGRILAVDAASGEMPSADRTYIAQLVAARTGLSQADAEMRVADVVGRAKAAADAARKTGVYVAIWAFISLLVGAFSASYMATVGGAARDEP